MRLACRQQGPGWGLALWVRRQCPVGRVISSGRGCCPGHQGLSAPLMSASVGRLNDGLPPSLLSGHAGEPVQTRNAAPTSQAGCLTRRLFLMCSIKVGGTVLGYPGEHNESEEALAGKAQSIRGVRGLPGTPQPRSERAMRSHTPHGGREGAASEKQPAHRRIENETPVDKHELRALRAGGSLRPRQAV